MIIVRLMGGLGNQMFQYAAGRALALKHGTVLKLDLSFLRGSQEGNTPRKFMLDNLNISAEIAAPGEVPPLEEDDEGLLLHLVRRVCLGLIRRKSRRNVLYEFDNRINHAYFSAPDGSYLVGYWQSERYFMDVAPLIRKEFEPINPLDGANREIADFIGKTNSVAVHIRREDYVDNPEINAIHGVCPLEYYQRCVAEVGKVVDAPYFFFFSDAPAWVRRHISIPFPFTIIDHNPPGMPVEDLRLMTLCKHNIIANSSFSWWGAWLNGNPGKRVFAPMRWFATPGHIPEDLIPQGWERY